MTKAGFGEHLRREREMRGVSLDEICAATRIGTRLLEALESEDWERLPGGVFNRGFVRAVARYLGLDEEGTVAEYVMAVNQGTGVAAATPHIEPRPMQKQDANWLRRIAPVAILLLVGGGGMLGWRFYSAHRAQARAAQAQVAVPAPLPAPPAGNNSTVPTPSGSDTAAPAATDPATDKLVLKI